MSIMRKKVAMSKETCKTNRDWLKDLTNKQLSEFLTCGVVVRNLSCPADVFRVSIHDIARRYTSSTLGIELWLSATQEYVSVEGGARMDENE